MEKVLFRATQLQSLNAAMSSHAEMPPIQLMTTALTNNEIRINYEALLKNILSCLQKQNVSIVVPIVHFDSNEWSEEIKIDIKNIEVKVEHEFAMHLESEFAGKFPATEEELLSFHDIQLDELHLLIDAAHFVEYALQGIYAGYVDSHDMLKKICYIYLGYERFTSCIPEFPLIKLTNLYGNKWVLDKSTTPMWFDARKNEIVFLHSVEDIPCPK